MCMGPGKNEENVGHPLPIPGMFTPPFPPYTFEHVGVDSSRSTVEETPFSTGVEREYHFFCFPVHRTNDNADPPLVCSQQGASQVHGRVILQRGSQVYGERPGPERADRAAPIKLVTETSMPGQPVQCFLM